MKVGTKSVLFGVHAVWWHFLTVGLAWRRLYKKWPSRWEWLAIFLHDTAYVGCNTMDGPDGKMHPKRAAENAVEWVLWLGGDLNRAIEVYDLVAGHSRSFCALTGHPVSRLCDPDKLSVLYDPAWFYWLRATASGEIFEYRDREEVRRGETFPTVWQWLQSYRRAIRARFSSRL